MERLGETIGVEVLAAASPAAEVGLDRSPFFVTAPLLAGDAPAGDAPLRVRFVASLESGRGAVGPRLVGEPSIEALLAGRCDALPAASAAADLVRMDDPEALDVLGDPSRVPPAERAVRASALVVAARARVCAWEALEARPPGPRTLIVEHGLTIRRAGDRGAATTGFVVLGARRLRYLEDGFVQQDEVGVLTPRADGDWLGLDGDALRVLPPADGAGFELRRPVASHLPRERARRRAEQTPWPPADVRVEHLARTLDAVDRVTPARLKTLVRLLGLARPDPLASLLFAEGLLPMAAVVFVLGPSGAARDGRLREALRASETRLDGLSAEEAFRLTRVLAEGGVGSSA